ncbi:MAG: phytanoyl-CoA dioxygenase family protein [Iamia sp.]
MRPTFGDPHLQQQFDALGYVVVDFLPPPVLERLLAGYHAMTHDHENYLPFADGFHTTLYDRRDGYRREVATVIREAVEPAMAAVFDDYEVQFANFTVKLPGGDAVPEHLDWTFVDEDECRSVTVWCAMQDMDDHNGALGVVPGSHHKVEFVRAVNHRSYEVHAAVAASIPERVVVAVEAGQAVVIDNRLVHFSPPNGTERIRLAAACVAAPKGRAIVHHWFDEDGRPHRLEVTPEFWLRYSPGVDDPRAIPGCVSDRVITDPDILFS